MKAMVLAAGRGQRMMPLTESTPKPLLQVHAKPLLHYHLQALAEAGIDDVVINHAYLGQQIVDYCQQGRPWGMNIEFSAEQTPLETAGGIIKALPKLGERPFLAISSDVYTDIDFAALSAIDLGAKLAHIILVKNPEHHPNGDFSLSPQGLLSVDGPNRLTYSGIALLSPQLFSRYRSKTAKLGDLFQQAMRQQQVSAQLHTGDWLDVGTPQRLAQAEQSQPRTATSPQA